MQIEKCKISIAECHLKNIANFAFYNLQFSLIFYLPAGYRWEDTQHISFL